jgi:bacteriorhodopsin
LFYIVYVLVWEGRRHASRYGSEVNKAFLYCGSLTAFLWILYPVAWGLCEGGNVISPDSEAIFYGILDFIAKPCFGALLIFGHRNIDPATIGMAILDYEDDTALRRGEKRGLTNSNVQPPLDGPAATNGSQV